MRVHLDIAWLLTVLLAVATQAGLARPVIEISARLEHCPEQRRARALAHAERRAALDEIPDVDTHRLLAGFFQRGFRYVKYGNILIPELKQMIHQQTVAPAYVDDAGMKRYFKLAEKLQGCFRSRLIPAYFIGLFGLVYFLPVFFALNGFHAVAL